jgi:chemotaxis response regulator CheB
MTFLQSPEMPHSAIRTGAVDYEVPPAAIAPLLENSAARYGKGKSAGA